MLIQPSLHNANILDGFDFFWRLATLNHDPSDAGIAFCVLVANFRNTLQFCVHSHLAGSEGGGEIHAFHNYRISKIGDFSILWDAEVILHLVRRLIEQRSFAPPLDLLVVVRTRQSRATTAFMSCLVASSFWDTSNVSVSS